MPNLNIGILGIGAIGSVIALALKKSANKFYFNRSPIDTINLNRNSILESLQIELSEEHKVENLDWLIVCLKEYHYQTAHEQLKTLINPKTKILVIRNGLMLKEHLLKYTIAENIIASIIDCSVLKTNDKHSIQNNPILTLDSKEDFKEVQPIFEQDKINLQRTNNFNTAAWEKLIESSALGSLLCLANQNFRLFKDPEIVALYFKVVKEGIAVAKSTGVLISKDFIKKLEGKLQSYSPEKETSMLIDRRMGRPIEVMAKNGLIAEIGKRNAVKCQLNSSITEFLKQINI